MKKIIALACLSALPFSYTAAEGFQVNAQSTKQAGMGHVGAAMKLGAESMHFNPAGLAFMDKTIDLSAGVSGVFAHAKYSSSKYYSFVDNNTAIASDYTAKTDNTPSTPLYFYAGFKIYDNLAAGISLNTPYGSGINWGNDWQGAHLVQNISLQAFNLQPTVAWKIIDKLSIGAGLMVMFGNISLDRALIGPGSMTAVGQSMVNAIPENMLPLVKPMVDPIMEELSRYEETSAASVSLNGSSQTRFGFNVGAMYDINDKWTVGLSYRSKVTAKVNEGDIQLRYANREHFEGVLEQINSLIAMAKQMGIQGLPDGINVPPLETGTFSAELPLPDNWNVALTYRPTQNWVISGEVQFVGWNAYKSLDVNFHPDSELGKYNIAAPKEYENTRIYRIGAQYATTDRLDIRFGAYFDETPVKSEYLNPETPSMNKLGLTAGFSFRPLQRLSVDFSFSYVQGFARDGSYTDADLLGNPRTFGGHYQAYALMPAIGLSYGF